MKSYRTGFYAVLAAAMALAAVVAYQATRAWRAGAPAPAAASNVIASGPPLPAAKPDRQAAGVSAEAALAPVQLSDAERQAIGVRIGLVEFGPVRATIRTVGTVAVDQRRLAVVQARFSGWVTREYADQAYQFIHRGEPLVTIYSPEVAASEEAYVVARQNRALLAASTVPGVAAGAGSLLAASRQRLAQWQVPAREIARLERTGRPRRDITLNAPASGYVFERPVLPNQYVRPGTTLYEVADLSAIWVNAQVVQTDAGLLRLGEPATVTVDAYPGRQFTGRVDEIHPVMENATRTVPVRLELANPDGRLKPGMFVNVAIQVPLGRRTTVPASAVLQTGTRNIVFLARGGGYLTPDNVQLGPRVDDRFVVQRGLRAGQRIVTSANFLVDSESQLQAALGAYAPPPPGVSVSARQPSAPRIRFVVRPAATRAGGNRLEVTLAGADGRGLAGARVTVRFAMAAMPAMGMAAEQASAELEDRGRGHYAGTIQLPNGGRWHVLITAEKDGSVIAERRMSVGGGS